MEILVVAGDGIGPEVVRATLHVLSALQKKFGLSLELPEASCGLRSLEAHGVTVRPEDIERARQADGVILGPMSIRDYPPVAEGGVNVSAHFRTQLDLYANVRPSRVRPGVPAMAPQMDLVMVRENLEDFYADRNMVVGCGEFMPTHDICLAVGKITAQGTRRAARVAYENAQRRPRQRVTIVHKRPVLRAYHGLFVDTALEVARDFPDVETDEMLVDAAAAALIRSPERFDVVLTTNMLGDILSDEAAELAGSLGLAGSLNHGDACAVAQAAHGSAPDIAGKDLANPVAMMESVAMLLEHLGVISDAEGARGLITAACSFRHAVDVVLENPETRTRDLGGTLGTQAFAEAVVNVISHVDLL